MRACAWRPDPEDPSATREAVCCDSRWLSAQGRRSGASSARSYVAWRQHPARRQRCTRGSTKRLGQTLELFGGGCRGEDEFHGAFLYVAADVPGAHCRAPRNMGSSDEGFHVVPANRVGHGEQLASTNAPQNSIAPLVARCGMSRQSHRARSRKLAWIGRQANSVWCIWEADVAGGMR